jgi:YD repeat-containing protein
VNKLLPLTIVSVILVACASAPAPTEVAEKPTVVEAPKKTTRVITVRVPVEMKSSVRFSDNSLDEYTQTEYDPSLTRVLAQSKFSASGAPIERIEYTYGQDRLISKTTKDGEGLTTSRRSFSYDSNGRLVSETLVDGAGKAMSTFEYAYDANGHKTKWVVKDAKGTMVAETSYSYSGDKVRSAELRDGTGKKTGSSAYEYDGDGHIVAQRFFDALGSLLRIENTAWKDGRLIKEERATAGGFVQQRISYEYGAEGELIRKTIEDSVGKSKQIVEYEYTFREDKITVEE